VKIAVYACDIGSTIQGRFAWKRLDPPLAEHDEENSEIEALVHSLKKDLKGGSSIALGFESPLFLPVPEMASQLSRARTGESSRSCFAPTGAAVTTLAVHQAAWILREIRADNIRFTLAVSDWPPTGPDQILFCWEAFVSGPAKASCLLHAGKPQSKCRPCRLLHQADADIALAGFQEAFKLKNPVSAITTTSSLSLIGTAALWSGWATDSKILHEQAFVVRPAARSLAEQDVQSRGRGQTNTRPSAELRGSERLK
jgi:hypothetical protein